MVAFSNMKKDELVSLVIAKVRTSMNYHLSREVTKKLTKKNLIYILKAIDKTPTLFLTGSLSLAEVVENSKVKVSECEINSIKKEDFITYAEILHLLCGCKSELFTSCSYTTISKACILETILDKILSVKDIQNEIDEETKKRRIG